MRILQFQVLARDQRRRKTYTELHAHTTGSWASSCLHMTHGEPVWRSIAIFATQITYGGPFSWNVSSIFRYSFSICIHSILRTNILSTIASNPQMCTCLCIVFINVRNNYMWQYDRPSLRSIQSFCFHQVYYIGSKTLHIVLDYPFISVIVLVTYMWRNRYKC